jgi:hypothetical protein
MESIATFYQMLFTVEIAIFGILAAALFVFIQLVYGHFSYRHISIVLKTPSYTAPSYEIPTYEAPSFDFDW